MDIYLASLSHGGAPQLGPRLSFFHSQGAANYLLSELTISCANVTTDTNAIKFRAVQWAISA